MSATYDRLHEYVSGLEIIDTHEHLPGHEEQRSRTNDVLSEYLIHYFSCDLVSAGLRPEQLEVARDASKPLADRWKLVEPFWNAARNTGYGRSLDIAARDLYGFDRIDRETIAPLNAAFAAFRAEGNTYQKVLKERCRIRLSINDAGLTHDPRFFRPTVRLDDFVMVANMGHLWALEKRSGLGAIHTLDDLLDACERTLDDALGHGAVCLKSGLAYRRSLRYERVTTTAAEEDFHRVFSDDDIAAGGREGAWGRTARLQDFMMHHVCRLADRRGMPFQFHTGIQEGNGNYIYHSDPALLSNLFIEYPNIRFDCFHIGYPYQQTLSVLAKNFRNVFIDFAWAHIISPAAAVAAMVEYLDAVPANKISGFGGDYCFLDGVYGHQALARQNVAKALAIKVDEGAFTMDQAQNVAKMILHDNPIAIFNLGKVLDAGAKANQKEKRNPRGKRTRA